MKSKYPYLINGDFNHVITPLDRGFSYGDGVFRTMLIRNSQPDNWPLHYQKLVADCAAIGIVCPSAELLMSDILQLFAADISDKSSEVAKIIITRGEGERGYAQPAITNPTRVILKSAIPRYSTDNQINGVQLHLCQTRLADQGKLAGIKHLNRLENVIARMEWHDDKIFDGILLDQKDNVIECTISNIFARYGNLLITPDLSRCGVAGITRQRIIWLESQLNLKIEVTLLPFEKLLQADEVIVCNSLFGAFQVNKIGQRTWQPQALAKTIRNEFSL
jgi:4-amino-4-deoxychorismate lyase